MKHIKEVASGYWHYALFTFFAACSVVGFAVTQNRDLLYIYDDGVSYLTIARLVVDNVQPGIEQIGSIWLPLSHFLKLPLIWNDFLYRSSLAGSLLSMISYVAACFFVFKTAYHITRSKVNATIAGLVFALNPTLLFLQSTAMSEVPFIAAFTASVYGFVRYSEKRGIQWLLLLGIINAAMILIRYEGWFVVAVQAAIMVLLQSLQHTTMTLKEHVGRLFIFILPVLLAVISWLLWNYNLNGDPLYFVRGDFSASVFTDRQQSYGIRAEGNVFVSLLLYGGAALSLIGLPAVLAASTGLVSWIFDWTNTVSKRTKIRIKSVDVRHLSFVVLLLSPALFHVLTMLFGYSVMRVAGIGGDTTSLNIRYGIFLLPYVAIGIATLSKRAIVSALVGVAVLVSYGIMLSGSMPIIDDALEGQIQYREAATVLRNNVREDDAILVSMATNSALMFHSNIDLDKFVHEGAHKEWTAAFEDPTEVEWVVKSRRQDFDTLSAFDVSTESTQFRLFFTNEDIALYRRMQ